MKKINTLNSVILSKAKNLKTYAVDAYRSFTPFWMTKSCMTLAMVLAFAGCSEEDLVQPANGQAGTLHITSVSVDGQQVKSRVVAEGITGSVSIDNLPANHSITGFSNEDEFELRYTFNDYDLGCATASYNGSSWTITNPIKPDVSNNNDDDDNTIDQLWANIELEAIVEPASAGPMSLGRQAGTTPAYVLGDIDDDRIIMISDCLYASTEDGSITVDKDLNSPTLGATTIQFKHQDALLRLPIPEEGFNVAGTYVVNGKAYNVTGLATLWAFLNGNYFDCYVPFTQVGNNLQAIVYDTYYTLAGFKAVLYATEVAAENTPMPSSTGSEPSTITIDLPFKVGGSAKEGIVLEENKQYPLTLTLSPNQAVVNLASATGKPGWNVSEEDEEVLTGDNYLTYNAADQYFEVNAPVGLQLLNNWMYGKITTTELKAYNFVGCSSIPNEAVALSANVRLKTDITLTAPEEEGESNWTAIGTSETPYTGTFDGNGHTITGMVINTTTEGQGFVRYLGEGGQIKNLTFAGAQVASTAEESWIGIVAGKINGATVENCYTAEGSSISGAQYVGGIVGGATNSKIAGCINAASVANTGGGDTGGIVGNTDNSIVILCGNIGGVSATGCSVGGIVGYYKNGSQNIASWTINTTEIDGFGNAASEYDGIGEDAGNIIACCSVANAAALNSKLDNMNGELWNYYSEGYTGLFWQETSTGWPTTVQQTVSGTSPYLLELKYIKDTKTFEVSTTRDLLLLNKWMNGVINTTTFKSYQFVNYEQLDNSATATAMNITLVADITLPAVGEGESNWTPIGTYYGTFDGDEHTIHNLTITGSSNSNLGLIGKLVDAGKVEDVNLVNVQITSTTTQSVGGIVGYITKNTDAESANSVSGCTVSGNINAPNAGNVGGIVGGISENYGKSPNTTIYQCTNAAVVEGNTNVGGIVGETYFSTKVSITECTNTGTINGQENVGGIVGKFTGPYDCSNSATLCNNSGNVNHTSTSQGSVGGIAGVIKNVTITSCTNMGNVNSSSSSYLGGIVGYYESNGILEGCTNTYSATLAVNAENSSSSSYVGGIVGYFFKNAKINVKGCVNHAAINFTCNNVSNYVAGIAAWVDDYYGGDGFIACGNTGNINITGSLSSSSAVGGISAYTYDCTFYGCWSKDVVESGTGDKDGFGNTNYTEIEGCVIATTESNITEDVLNRMNDALDGKGWQWVAGTNGGWPTLQKTSASN